MDAWKIFSKKILIEDVITQDVHRSSLVDKTWKLNVNASVSRLTGIARVRGFVKTADSKLPWGIHQEFRNLFNGRS